MAISKAVKTVIRRKPNDIKKMENFTFELMKMSGIYECVNWVKTIHRLIVATAVNRKYESIEHNTHLNPKSIYARPMALAVGIWIGLGVDIVRA